MIKYIYVSQVINTAEYRNMQKHNIEHKYKNNIAVGKDFKELFESDYREKGDDDGN